MDYRVPVQEIEFVLQHVAGLAQVLALPGMADFSPDILHAVLLENARFTEEQIAPLYRAGDLTPPVWENGAVRATPGFAAAFGGFAAGGWQGLGHSQELGGQGLPGVFAAALTENLNAANLAFSLCPLLTDGVIEALALVGTPAQRQTFIPPLIEGRWSGTMNLTEPQAGSDLALLRTRAAKLADGSYAINGQKIFITWGEHDMVENIVHLVLARTPDAPKGVKGISLFIVPKFLPQEGGGLGARNDVYCASIEHKLGIHASPTAVMLYGSGQGEVGAEGAVGFLVGEENRGLEYMFIMMNAARFAVGLQGLAIAERAVQQASAYAAERIQGGAIEGSGAPVPIAQHPDVARMLGTMRGLTEGARAMAYAAASQRDLAQGEADAAARARHQAIYEYFVPIVKAFATESAVEVASLGLQVHGGTGYIEDTGAAQILRDARILPIYEGTTAIQANDFLGRKLARDSGAVALGQLAQIAQLAQALAAASCAHAQALRFIAQRLQQAAHSYQQALQYLQENLRQDIRAVFAGSVPCLMLAGSLHAGAALAKGALAAAKIIADGASDPYYPNKIATAVHYAAFVLPRCQSLLAAIQAGVLVDKYRHD